MRPQPEHGTSCRLARIADRPHSCLVSAGAGGSRSSFRQGQIPGSRRVAEVRQQSDQCLAKAYRWRRLIRNGQYASASELSKERVSMNPMPPACFG